MSYPGAKNALSRVILNEIPPHRVYIEPFLGSGVIMQTKLAALENIGIDRDPVVIGRAQSWMSTFEANTQAIQADSLAWLELYPFRGDEFVFL